MSSAGAGTAAALYALTSITTPDAGAEAEEAKDKRHHLKGGKGFVNPWDSYKDLSAPGILWDMLWRKISGQANSPDTTPPTVPVQQPTFLPSRITPKLRATWLGHACYYIEFPSGLRVLFDPVFEDCCAPINMPNLKRYTPPPCEVEDIPIIDAVVISHNHYDHLSHPTIMRIVKKHPNVQFFVPLGNKQWFHKCGIKNVTEMDWWEAREMKLDLIKNKSEKVASSSISVTTTATEGTSKNDPNPDTMVATIHCLPCQHTTARGPFDRNATLWASWSINSGGSNVYFAGDTGYRTVPKLPKGVTTYSKELTSSLPTCPAFTQIGKLIGPFDLGLIPIGAYEPRFIFSPMHACPEDSVGIFLDTKCRRALGMHWGTWVLTEEDVLEPPRELRRALSEKGVRVEEGEGYGVEEVFGVCGIGESREFESGK
ncbi:Metallo-hydrolase/oxidoreductase [Delitschia confertaspora ATCC 74209]|uniref:Metallo-hydrolase/oxidoreductase n=1 Tax=Delitschia confertaspora ATCC 74209 TaxID=1513339 RepID=A0A9P4MRU8_9PLEO|nr:Metallo-hydrolase/oxidoreductase [Delitschia confertaspora ATCC 74209]